MEISGKRNVSNGSSDISLSPNLRDSVIVRSVILEADLSALAETLTTRELLKATLSMRPVVSTVSSAAQRVHDASRSPTLRSFRSIGAGSFGSVYEHVGHPRVLKLPKAKDQKARDTLWNEFQHQVRIVASYQACGVRLSSVPYAISFINRKHDFWNSKEAIFLDKKAVEPIDGIFAQRIPPLPYPVRAGLIKEYCPERHQQEALESPANKDCLIRLYLGQTSKSRARGALKFSLRNFVLRIDQMEDLGLPVYDYATAMAESLAIMHWHAEVDAKDIEFVLGSQPPGDPAISPADLLFAAPGESVEPENFDLDFFDRAVRMWILDFNQVNSITMDQAGVDLAVKAFFFNDPYFPRPNNPGLWRHFVQRYLHYARRALHARPGGRTEQLKPLPKRFIEGIEKEFAIREGRKVAAEERLAKADCTDEHL